VPKRPTGAAALVEPTDRAVWPNRDRVAVPGNHDRDTAAHEAIRVLIADHETLVRYGVRAVLEISPGIQVVGEAATSDEAINQTIRLCPTVLLIDCVFPDGDGIAAIRTIKERRPDTRVVVLTSRSDPVTFSQATTAGATGYILKDVTSENLINALRAASDNQTILSPAVVQRMLRQFSPREAATGRDGISGNGRQTDHVSQQDVEVLSRVAQGFSDKEIAAQLFLSECAIKSRLRQLYRRLGLKNRAQAVVFALEEGLIAVAGAASRNGASPAPGGDGAPRFLPPKA
jgi:DNA-binding NarL/FixJ family response regulator